MLTLRTSPVRRYRVVGQLPPRPDEAFFRRLTDRRFLPLTEHEERTYGWVTADNLLVTRFEADTVLRGSVAAFGLRIDRRRVNPRLLRARLDLEIEGRRRAAADAGERFRLSRDERQRLRAEVREALQAETNPSVDAWTVLLHPRRKLLELLTLAKQPHEVLLSLFRDTFGLDLEPLTPWRRATEILAGRPEAVALGTLERTEFGAPDVIVADVVRRSAPPEGVRVVEVER